MYVAKIRHILVVEDVLDVAEIAVESLELSGYRVTHAETADAAISRINAGETFDLVFSDICMPGAMNGIDLAHQLKASWPNIPVLLTTGYSDVAIEEGYKHFEIVQKPYLMVDIERRIERLLKARV